MEHLLGQALNISIVGNPECGKNTLSTELCGGNPRELLHYAPEVSAFKSILVDTQAYFWIFSSLTSPSSKTIVEKSDVILLVYNSTNAESFAAAITKWSTEVSKTKSEARVILVGTNVDALDECVVPTEMAKEFSQCEGQDFVQVHTTDGPNSGHARLRTLIHNEIKTYKEDLPENDEVAPVSILPPPAPGITRDIWLYEQKQNQAMFVPMVIPGPKMDTKGVDSRRTNLRRQTGNLYHNYLKPTYASKRHTHAAEELERSKMQVEQEKKRKKIQKWRKENMLYLKTTENSRRRYVSKNVCKQHVPKKKKKALPNHVAHTDLNIEISLSEDTENHSVFIKEGDNLRSAAENVVVTLSPESSPEEMNLLVNVLADRLHESHISKASPRVLAALRVEFSKEKSAVLTIREGENVDKALNEFQTSHSHLLQHGAQTSSILLRRRLLALISRSNMTRKTSDAIVEGEFKLHGVPAAF